MNAVLNFNIIQLFFLDTDGNFDALAPQKLDPGMNIFSPMEMLASTELQCARLNEHLLPRLFLGLNYDAILARYCYGFILFFSFPDWRFELVPGGKIRYDVVL